SLFALRSLFPSTSSKRAFRFFPARIKSGINKNGPPKSDQNKADLKNSSCATGFKLASNFMYLKLSFESTACFCGSVEPVAAVAELIGPFSTSIVNSFEVMVLYFSLFGSKNENEIGFTGYVPLNCGTIV